MTDMTGEQLKAAFGFDNDSSIESAISTADPKLNERSRVSARKRLDYWLLGIIIAFAPVLMLPLAHAVMSKTIGMFFNTLLWELFTNYQILFIAITLSLVALLDYIGTDSNTQNSGFVSRVIAIIVLYMVPISVFTFMNAFVDEEIDSRIYLWFNIILFTIAFVNSLSNYVIKLKGEKNANRY
jgi:hypothetical protein